MKHLALIAVLCNIVADALFFAYLPEKQAYFFAFILAFASVLIYLVLMQQMNRRYWKKNPIEIDDPRFDSFFWNMEMVNQDWYIDNILKEDDLQTLINRYEDEVKGIWTSDIEVADKIEKSKVYVGRIRTLLTIIEFSHLRPS